MKGRTSGRAGAAPRSAVILTALLLIAVGALFLVKQKKSTVDYTLGGPLFPAGVQDIEGLLLTRQGSQYRLDRTASGVWTLSGAVADYVDSLAVLKLLDTLTLAPGGPLLPGTDVEDRRYGFNGPEAIRLTVFLETGEAISLAVGTGNPVAGKFYASGAGREACFMVPAALVKVLGELPGSVQARQLLPGVNRDKVTQVELLRGDREARIEKRAGRWWMQMPPEGPAYLGEEVRSYQAMYSDRRTTDGQGTWVLASRAAMELLIYQVSDIIVRDIMPPDQAASLVEAWQLDPPWRRVVLTGQGLNLDPTADSPDRMVISFGPALDVQSVPALRRGNVVLTDPGTLDTLEQPLGILAHRTALTFGVLEADTISLKRENRLLLRGDRSGTAVTPEGREAWQTIFPPEGAVELGDTDRHGFIQDLAVNLERIPVLAVLPPTGDSAVLAERERVKIRVSFVSENGARNEVFEIGYLVEENLPDGSPPLAPTEGKMPPTALWFPADGKLLQIPGQILVTARNLVQFTPAESPE